MRPTGLVEQFNARIAAYPDRVFAQTEEGEITFAALSAASDRMIHDLMAHGVRQGDFVAIMMKNSMLSLAMVYATLRAGFVWVPINPALVGQGLAHVIGQVEPAIILCDSEFTQVLEASGANAREGTLPYTDTRLPSPPDRPWTGAAPMLQDLAAIMFTSGTTGSAKGVEVTHSMLETAARGVEVVTGLRPGDNLYMWEPFYHVGGAQVIVLPILADVTLSIADRFSASQFWEQVTRWGATHIHHLGGILQILLKQPHSDRDRAHGVRVAWGGGCSPDMWTAFEDRFGVRIVECYGMTEASSIITCNDTGLVGAVGRALPWFDVRVVDRSGRNLAPGDGRGEIVITSDVPGTIFPGYHNAPTATAEALRHDGYHTGDLGSWGKGGQLFFHGRMSDSFRCRGENVSAYEVESVANSHPDIAESALVGVPGEIGEFDLRLFVQMRESAQTSMAELATWLDGQLARYQQPRFIATIDSFPKTPSQRIRKHLLPPSPEGQWERPTA